MTFLKNIANLLSPEAWATYITVAAILGIGVYQFKQQFRLREHTRVFHELNKDLDDAKRTSMDINSTAATVIQKLGDAANESSKIQEIQDRKALEQEVKRRVEDVDNIAEALNKHIAAIFDSYGKLLSITQKIEKSTLVEEYTRQAARHLYFAALDQHQLVQAVSNILLSLRVTPPIGEHPNIAADTFNKFVGLIKLINSKNDDIANYIDDLGVILHNDLVKKVFGRAKMGAIPSRHLSANGIVDARAKEPLI